MKDPDQSSISCQKTFLNEHSIDSIIESHLEQKRIISATDQNPNNLYGDVIYGADAIAEFLYGARSYRRRVYNLIRTDRIPHFRLGVTLCIRKSALLAWIVEQENTQRN